MVDLTYWRDLQKLAEYACTRFGVGRLELLPTTNPRTRCMGSFDDKGVIELRVHRQYHTNTPLKWRTLVDTLAHELAHAVLCRQGVKSWHHHRRRHRETKRAILEFWMRHDAASSLAP